MAVLNRRDAYSAIPQLEGKLSSLSRYITAEEGKLQIKIEDLYGNVSTLTQTAESIEGRVEAIEGDYVTSSVLTQTASDLTLEINEKAQIFTSQPTPPYYVGDLWTEGPNGEIYRCKQNRASGSYTASDWEKASDYTDDTAANTEKNNRTMLVRAFNGGVITAYVGNSYGVYTNASGSVDIVKLSWSGNTPVINDTITSYGSSINFYPADDGQYSGSGTISSTGIQISTNYGPNAISILKGSTNIFTAGVDARYSTLRASLGGISITEGSFYSISPDSSIHFTGYTLYADGGLSTASIYATGNISANGSISGSSLSISGNATVNKLYVSTPGTASSSTANCRIATGESNRIMFTGSGSTRKIKHGIEPITEDALDPHKLYDAEVVQFIYNDDFLNAKDCRYGKPLAGFIAEDLLEVYPTAVDVEDGEAKDWNYRYIIPPMLKLIQEQHKEIEELKECMKELRR